MGAGEPVSSPPQAERSAHDSKALILRFGIKFTPDLAPLLLPFFQRYCQLPQSVIQR